MFLRALISGNPLPDKHEFHHFLDRVMEGDASKHEVVAFLAGLSARPLNVTTICHFVSYVRRINPPQLLPGSEGAVNIVGTGGGIATFNISTASALVASAAGAKVLKSGSKAYSSWCGSLEVLPALGVAMPDSTNALADMVNELGIGFIPASHYSSLLRRLAIMLLPLTFREVASFVNTVGPLLSPYRVSGQLIGVSRPEYLDIFADAVTQLACPRTLLAQASVGMDELCSWGVNQCRLIDGSIESFTLPAARLGFSDANLDRLAGGDAQKNAAILREVIVGRRHGIARDTVILNGAALLFVAGMTPSIEAGIKRCADAIDVGKAHWQLERIVAWGRRVSSSRQTVFAGT